MTEPQKPVSQPVSQPAAPEAAAEPANAPPTAPAPPEKPKKVEEIGGPPGPEPTRYGDWQFNGKVTDF